MVSEMLNVLGEDVLDLLADAFENRFLNREAFNNGAFIKKEPQSRFVEYPRDKSVDRLDGLCAKTRSIIRVEEIVMSFVEKGLEVDGDYQTLSGDAEAENPVDPTCQVEDMLEDARGVVGQKS